MQSEAGIKMQECIKAVCRMHSSVSKLLTDFDKYAAWPSTSIFQNTATKDLTYATRANYWMPEGVFRYLSCKTNPVFVEAITICFIGPTIEEPLLLLGKLEYTEDPLKTRTVCDGWDLWHLYFQKDHDRSQGVAINCTIPADRSTKIQTATIISVPLYNITQISDISDLFIQLRNLSNTTEIARIQDSIDI